MKHRATPEELNQNEIKFVETYLINGNNGSNAYKEAHKDKNYKASTVSVHACKLLKKPNIKAYLKVRQEEIAEKARITTDETFRSMAEIAYFLRGKTKAQKRKDLKEYGQFIVSALRDLAKAQKLFEPEAIIEINNEVYTGPIIMLPQKKKIK